MVFEPLNPDFSNPHRLTPMQPPDTEPTDGEQIAVCFSLDYVPYVQGALDVLQDPAAWALDRDDPALITTIDRMQELQAMFTDPECTAEKVPTPFWDTAEDVDDDATIEEQTWYGGVTDPNAPAGELDFVESAILWAFTGLIALATFEVGGLAPAIVFHTSVEKFLIIQKRGDVAETIRYVVDGNDFAFVNTAPYSEGELITTQIVTPQTGGEHTLMIVGGAS